jgi:hypothetical protein
MGRHLDERSGLVAMMRQFKYATIDSIDSHFGEPEIDAPGHIHHYNLIPVFRPSRFLVVDAWWKAAA